MRITEEGENNDVNNNTVVNYRDSKAPGYWGTEVKYWGERVGWNKILNVYGAIRLKTGIIIDCSRYSK